MISVLAVAVLLSQAGSPPVLTFDEALRQTESQNLDLTAARARLERSRAQVSAAWAGYLPQLSVGANYTLNSDEATITLPSGYFIRDIGQPTAGPFDPSQEASPENPPGAPTSLILFPSGFNEVVVQKRHQLGARAELRQAIFVPALYAAIHNAKLGVEIGELQYDAARRELLFGVAQAYFAAAGLKESTSVQERLLETQRRQEQSADARYRAGDAPKIDLLRAQIDRARAEQGVVRTGNAYRSALSGLATLLGREPDFEVPGADVLPPEDAPDSTPSVEEALDQRPDVRAARLTYALAEDVKRATYFNYLPNLNFSAQYQVSNVSGFTGRADTWAMVLALSWNLFDGGLRESQIRQASAAIIEAEAQRRAIELRAKDELRRARLELDSARANRKTSAQQVELARESLRIVQVAYEAGVSTSLDVSNASSALLGAELSQINESLSAWLASLSLLKAAGAFDAPASVESNP